MSIHCVLYCTWKAVNPWITKGRYTFSLLSLGCKTEEERLFNTSAIHFEAAVVVFLQ